MKKILVMAVVAMMTTTAMAQPGYDDTKHEVAVSLGGLSNSQWIDVFEDVTTTIVGARYDDGSSFGPISAEYFYHLTNWFGVGGIFVYGNSKQEAYMGKIKKENHMGVDKSSYYTLMPAAKFDWLRNEYFGLYSKVAVGATLRNEKMEYDDGKDDYSETSTHINWQVSLLGVEAGSPRIRGFLEVGCGEQGLALVGLRCKF